MDGRHELLAFAAQIVSAHVQRSTLLPDQLPQLIHDVYAALSIVAHVASERPGPVPAVPVKRSVSPSRVVCLDCGRSFSILKRHLMTDHQLTPQQYRQRWALPVSYPLVAPNYAKTRSALAKKIGLGSLGSALPRQSARKTG
jgi:MucR family transcriptional regulator, transcriptional regulator of exopolysaccharide biosynthesis